MFAHLFIHSYIASLPGPLHPSIDHNPSATTKQPNPHPSTMANNTDLPPLETLTLGTSSFVEYPEAKHQHYKLYALYKSTVEPHLATRPVSWSPLRSAWDSKLQTFWNSLISHCQVFHLNNRACGVCKSKNGDVRGDVEGTVEELERDMLVADVASGLTEEEVNDFEGRWVRCDTQWWTPGVGGERLN